MAVTVSYIRRTDADTIVARDENGEFEAHDGDSFDMGGGIIVTVMGPAVIGGGTVKACVAAVLAVFIGLGIAGMFGFGKGMGGS